MEVEDCDILPAVLCIPSFKNGKNMQPHCYQLCIAETIFYH